MAKWYVQVMFTGCVDVEVEANSRDEAHDKATMIANASMIDDWDCDVTDGWCEEDD